MKKYLNKTIECSCGREHKVPIKDILIKENALAETPDILNKLTNKEKIFIICDQNTYEAAGKKLKKILKNAAYEVETVCLTAEKVIPDPKFLFKILEKVGKEGYLLACGSGTINDLTRFLSFKLDQPYSVVGTAPSMDGYASSVSSITVDGVKKTYRVAPPEAIIADLSVLKKAPWELIQAGFGDLLGKITSLMDWKLSSIIFDEYYCERVVNLVEKELEKIIKVGPDLKNRKKESIEVLIRGLIGSGLAMLMIGSSRPASGSEHHISHFLEMYGLMYDEEIPPHGVKVGVGTYFSSSFYLKLEKLDFADLEITHSLSQRSKQIKKDYKDRAQPALENLENRWEKEKIDISHLRQKEEKVKNLIQENKDKLSRVSSHLKNTGILEREDVKDLKREWLKNALNSGLEIRNRFTVSTLLKQVGYLNKFSQELLDQFYNEIKK